MIRKPFREIEQCHDNFPRIALNTTNTYPGEDMPGLEHAFLLYSLSVHYTLPAQELGAFSIVKSP